MSVEAGLVAAVSARLPAHDRLSGCALNSIDLSGVDGGAAVLEELEASRRKSLGHDVSPAPLIGDRIQSLIPRLGIRCRGTVHYIDELQMLIKWDNGRSQSLRRTGTEAFSVLPRE